MTLALMLVPSSTTMADKNYSSHMGEVGSGEGGLPKDIGPLEPPADYAPWQDTLKFSDAHNGDLYSAVIQGGLEDCCDMNNGSSNLRLHCPDLRSGGSQVFTIKGGCSDIWVSGIITVPGKVTDVDIDNYSDQSHAASKNISLNLTRADGKPVRYRSLKGCKVHICNPNDPYTCSLYLPYWLGMAWDTLYHGLKKLGICQ